MVLPPTSDGIFIPIILSQCIIVIIFFITSIMSTTSMFQISKTSKELLDSVGGFRCEHRGIMDIPVFEKYLISRNTVIVIVIVLDIPVSFWRRFNISQYCSTFVTEPPSHWNLLVDRSRQVVALYLNSFAFEFHRDMRDSRECWDKTGSPWVGRGGGESWRGQDAGLPLAETAAWISPWVRH